MDVLCVGETLTDIITRPVSSVSLNNDLSLIHILCLIRTAYPIETPDLFVPWTLSFQRVKPEYPQPISAARA